MKKLFTLVLALCMLFVFTSCKNDSKNISSSSYVATTISSATTINSTVQTGASTTTVNTTTMKSEVEATHSIPAVTTTSTATAITTVQADIPTTIVNTTKKRVTTVTSSSTTNIKTTSTTTRTKCCQRYKEGSLVVLGGDWRERKPGIENRITLMAKCTEKRPVVYKCPQCLEIALYEELEPKGHDFSGGEEILIRYPTVEQEGCYGIRCQNILCDGAVKTTKALPKRTGDYSTIDSCFEVVITGLIPGGERYEYKTEDLGFSIYEKRTWGSVPTITYDEKSNSGTVSVLQKDGSSVTYNFTIDLEKIDQGMYYTGRIQENGVYSGYYWTLGSNGTAN